ncbi:MAG: helix-hairpin-helix domain-containing protein [candidate division KSB1 bacterium]|nr:helix-hairpin-helix domain-containing protein [candidate division KSB1 bacterium]
MLGLTRQERWVLAFLSLALVIGSLLNVQRRRDVEKQASDPEAEAFLKRFFELSTAAQAETVRDEAGKKTSPVPLLLDLNRASAKELEKLPRIGPALAQRIVEARQRRGGFKRVEDLLEVKGIGKKTLEAIRPYVCVGTAEKN